MLRKILYFFAIVLFFYGVLYAILPKRAHYCNPYVESHREFSQGWETALFSPTGYAEALAVHCLARVRPSREWAQLICVDKRTGGYTFRFKAAPLPPPVDAVIPESADILDRVLQTAPNRHGETQSPLGTRQVCKYPDCDLDRAEQSLTPTYPRPWTISKVLAWYRHSTDEKVRIHLAHILGASRDPRAALVLGEAIDSRSPDYAFFYLRCQAAVILNNYFVPAFCGGNLESDFRDSEDWLADNRVRLETECSKLNF